MVTVTILIVALIPVNFLYVEMDTFKPEKNAMIRIDMCVPLHVNFLYVVTASLTEQGKIAILVLLVTLILVHVLRTVNHLNVVMDSFRLVKNVTMDPIMAMLNLVLRNVSSTSAGIIKCAAIILVLLTLKNVMMVMLMIMMAALTHAKSHLVETV